MTIHYNRKYYSSVGELYGASQWCEYVGGVTYEVVWYVFCVFFEFC